MYISSDWHPLHQFNLVPPKTASDFGGLWFVWGGSRRPISVSRIMLISIRISSYGILFIVNIDEIQFGFVPGRGTSDAAFIIRQLLEKTPRH